MDPAADSSSPSIRSRSITVSSPSGTAAPGRDRHRLPDSTAGRGSPPRARCGPPRGSRSTAGRRTGPRFRPSSRVRTVEGHGRRRWERRGPDASPETAARARGRRSDGRDPSRARASSSSIGSAVRLTRPISLRCLMIESSTASRHSSRSWPANPTSIRAASTPPAASEARQPIASDGGTMRSAEPWTTNARARVPRPRMHRREGGEFRRDLRGDAERLREREVESIRAVPVGLEDRGETSTKIVDGRSPPATAISGDRGEADADGGGVGPASRSPRRGIAPRRPFGVAAPRGTVRGGRSRVRTRGAAPERCPNSSSPRLAGRSASRPKMATPERIIATEEGGFRGAGRERLSRGPERLELQWLDLDFGCTRHGRHDTWLRSRTQGHLGS